MRRIKTLKRKTDALVHVRCSGDWLAAVSCDSLKSTGYVLAIEQLKGNAVCRTISGQLDGGLNVTASESLPRNPKPMTCHKLSWLANHKRLVLINSGCFVVG
jgi:hypothetical protein